MQESREDSYLAGVGRSFREAELASQPKLSFRVVGGSIILALLWAMGHFDDDTVARL
jgi:hypothetical protein